MTTISQDDPGFQLPEVYPPRWKLLQIITARPQGWRQWARCLWGFDLWLWRLPVLRTFAVLDAILVWALR